MVAISNNIVQASPVLSSPNVGSVNIRPSNQQGTNSPTTPTTSVQQESVKNNDQEKAVSTQDVQKAIQQANASFSRSNESIAFGYEEKLGQLFVTVTDKQSGEVVREIPSKEFIEHKIFMKEMVGLLLDRQA